MNETIPHGLRFLSTWFHDGHLVRLRRCDLAEGGMLQGVVFEISKSYASPSLLFLLPVCGSRSEFSVAVQKACLSFAITNSNPLDQPAQTNPSKVALIMVFYCSSRKLTNTVDKGICGTNLSSISKHR